MYEPSRMIDSFEIAGFQYHDGATVFDKLKVGKKLSLVAEFDNPYDPNAIAIKRKGVHLGYVPRDRNGFISQLLRFGHDDVVECRIVKLDRKAEPRNQVRVALYVIDKRKSKAPFDAGE
jgi:hypothetical protein